MHTPRTHAHAHTHVRIPRRLQHKPFMVHARTLKASRQAFNLMRVLPPQYCFSKSFTMALDVCAEARDLTTGTALFEMAERTLPAMARKPDLKLMTTYIKGARFQGQGVSGAGHGMGIPCHGGDNFKQQLHITLRRRGATLHPICTPLQQQPAHTPPCLASLPTLARSVQAAVCKLLALPRFPPLARSVQAAVCKLLALPRFPPWPAVCKSAGNADKAYSVFLAMKRRRMSLDAHVYCVLIAAFGEAMHRELTVCVCVYVCVCT